MKYNNTYFIQLSRAIFEDKYKSMSVNAKWLYCVLVELEHKYTGNDKSWFFRTDEELAEDSGMSLRTVRRAKQELKDSGLVNIGYAHYIDSETGKKSKKKLTTFSICRR